MNGPTLIPPDHEVPERAHATPPSQVETFIPDDHDAEPAAVDQVRQYLAVEAASTARENRERTLALSIALASFALVLAVGLAVLRFGGVL